MTKPLGYKAFLGIDNFNDKTRLKTDAGMRVQTGLNVDFHKDFHVSRRTGYTRVLTGNYKKSLWANSDLCLAVNNGNLVSISKAYAVTVLMSGVGDFPMHYETVYDDKVMRVYFTNAVVIGKVKSGMASLLSETNLQYKMKLPAGDIIKYFQGSLYVAYGKTLFVSDVLNREVFDRRWGWKQFESDIVMVEPVSDGLYVSDYNQVYFLRRVQPLDQVAATPSLHLAVVDDSPATKGTACKVFNVISPLGFHKEAIIWKSEADLCLGGDGGTIEKVTHGFYIPPLGISGTAVFKQEENLNQYITVIKQ